MAEAARRDMTQEREREPSAPAPANFDAAVAKAVEEKFAKFRDEMLGAMQPKTGIDLLGPLMEQLGLKMADIADQNNSRTIGQRVSPELLRQREDSHKRMLDLLDDVRRRGVMPEYRIKNFVVLDFGPGLGPTRIHPFNIDPATRSSRETEIQFDGIPNEQMIPIDDEARAIFEAYRGWIGDLKKVVPEDRLGITASGVVVKGGAVQANRQLRAGETNAADGPARRPAVRVSHLHRVGTEKRILGSIHPPVVVVNGA